MVLRRGPYQAQPVTQRPSPHRMLRLCGAVGPPVEGGSVERSSQDPRAVICRLVGVPDAEVRRLWTLWSGEGGQRSHSRLRLLEAVRHSQQGERVMSNLVTFSVLREIGELASSVSAEQIAEVFVDVTLADLTRWADDITELHRRLDQAR
jgi:hypothetical protein